MYNRELKWLLRQARPYLWLHLGSTSCIIVSGLLTLLDPLIIKWLIDDILPNRKVRWLPIAAAAFLVCHIGRVVFSNCSGMLTFCAVQKMIYRIRVRLLRHLQQLSAKYHDETPAGEIQHRLEQDVSQVGELSGDFAPTFLHMIIVTILVVCAMFTLSPSLTYLVLALVPIFLFTRSFCYGKLRGQAESVREYAGKLSKFLQEHITAIIQVQLLRREDAEAWRCAKLSNDLAEAQIKRKKIELLFILMSLSLIIIGISAALGYGGYLVVSGSLSIGGLVAFYSYVTRLFEPLSSAVDISSRLHRIAASAGRILEVLDTQTPSNTRLGSVNILPEHSMAIEFRNVTFRYGADRLALSGINFQVEAGERIALVGRNGSGKSTVAKLIVRLYDVERGSVLINGCDVRSIPLNSLRANVTLMLQDIILFDATLRENLLFANPEATPDELAMATQQAQMQELLRRLPRGLDEPLGPRSNKLSGGERQRISLARSILQRPHVLIIDEPTSSLDMEAEQGFLKALHRFLEDKTTIIISHDPAAIMRADRIIFMDRGKIVAEGTHTKLFRENAAYRILYEKEAGMIN